MLSPITATIESARFSARIHSALTTYKKREEAEESASRGAVEKWAHFIIASSQRGTKKRGTVVRLSLNFTFIILLLGHRQLLVNLCHCLI